MRKFTRRELLLSVGTASAASLLKSPVEILTESLLSGLLQGAQAQSRTGPARNYLHISLFGAPPRWFFDLPLTPFSNAGFVPNAMVRNRYAGGGTQYATTAVAKGGKTFNLPHLWQFGVPTPGGGTRPMTDLFDNMAVIRGFNMGSDSHTTNHERQLRPVTNGPSLDGLVADRSTARIPAVGAKDRTVPFGYKAPSGLGQVVVDSTLAANPLEQILGSFIRTAPAAFVNRKNAIDASIERGLDALKSYSMTNNPGAEALYKDRANAEALLKQGIGNLPAEWNRLFTKYQTLMNLSIRGPAALAGINDQAMAASNTEPMWRVFQNSNQAMYYIGNADVRTLVSNAYIQNLAEYMAVSEYLLVTGLSSSINIHVGHLSGLRFENYRVGDPTQAVNATPKTDGASDTDEHLTGIFSSVLINSVYFRALSACLLELVTVLKATTRDGKSVFDETVIHIGSEFSRIGRNDGGGSDHGWTGASTSILSGAIKQPLVVGNIYNQFDPSSPFYSVRATYDGTWGEGAPVIELGNRNLNPGHVAATLADLLRVARPLKNELPVLSETSGGIISLIGDGRNV
ncbi:MAG: hypothetical protein ABL958_05085 [Bdellovibrionia bacterium]